MPFPPLRIVADANIPHAEAAFQRFGAVERLPGAAITPHAVATADVLFVRSVTVVDRALLAGSPVRFVGSATIGTDHVDGDYLAEQGIPFVHAPGSNAESVVEYVLAALGVLGAAHGRPLRGATVGIVGCGQIGGRLAERLPALGARVLCNDPPRAADAPEGVHSAFHSLSELLDASDIVTLHPPLTRTGPHPTFHLIGREELARMREDAWLVNASRGAVVDNAALAGALKAGQLGGAVLDVWEGEPSPDPVLLERTTLATPHIAGYSYDGKVNGTLMLAEALAGWIGVPPDPALGKLLAPDATAPLEAPPATLPEPAWLDALIRQAYDIRADDARMRALLALPEAERAAGFQHLRKTYPRRRTFALQRVTGTVPYREAVTRGLGMEVGSGE